MGGISGCVGALPGIVGLWVSGPGLWGLSTSWEVCVSAPELGASPRVCEDASGDCRETAGGPGCVGCPRRGRAGPLTRPPQGRPQRIAGRAEAAGGKGGGEGPVGPAVGAAGLRGPRGAGGAALQRPPRREPPRAPGHGAAARPGPHPERQLEAFPAAAAAAAEDAGVPARAPRPTRPAAHVLACLASLLCQPIPNFPQAPSTSPWLSGFTGRQAWAG